MTAIAPIAHPVGTLDHPIAIRIREAAPQFAPFLPVGTDVEQVVAAVFLEVQRVPGIAECDPATVVSAASRLVSWGFDIGRTGYLVPFSLDGVKTCTPVPAAKGFIELALASGAASACEAREVREGDVFEYEFGSDAFLKHVPAIKRGKLTHFYVCWRVKFGYTKFDVMTADEVDAIRQRYSRQWKKGPLEAWYGIKTVIRRSAKQLPQNPKLAKFFAALGGDEVQEFGKLVVSAPVRELGAGDDPEPPGTPASSVTGEEITNEQTRLLVQLAKSHLWTDKESGALTRRASNATKAQATALIDNALKEMKARELKEKEAKAADPLAGTDESDLPF